MEADGELRADLRAAEERADAFMRAAFPGVPPEEWSDRVYCHVRDLVTEHLGAVRAAVAAERDRCARIAEAVREDNRAGVADGERGNDAYEAGAFIAARIRAGG